MGVPQVSMVVSVRIHGHPWRLDDLGYPYDVGHLQIFQYQHNTSRNQSISIPHWIQPCHSHSLDPLRPLRCGVLAGSGAHHLPFLHLEVVDPAESMEGTLTSWVNPRKRDGAAVLPGSGIAENSRRESKVERMRRYGKERNEKRKKVGLRAGLRFAVADASSWKWPAQHETYTSWGGFNDGAVPDMYNIMHVCILKRHITVHKILWLIDCIIYIYIDTYIIIYTGWWFGTFFIFPYIGTTNQYIYIHTICMYTWWIDGITTASCFPMTSFLTVSLRTWSASRAFSGPLSGSKKWMPWSQNTLKLSVCSECKHNFTGYIQSLNHKNGFFLGIPKLKAIKLSKIQCHHGFDRSFASELESSLKQGTPRIEVIFGFPGPRSDGHISGDESSI